METLLRIKRRVPQAIVPTRATDGAAGYDLYSAEDKVILSQDKAIVKTGISVAIPKGCYGRVAPRSGLASKHHIDIGAGVVDTDYRGDVGVVMFNLSKNEYHVKQGDRIAQLVLERILTPPVLEVDDLEATVRGEGGFGSTGLREEIHTKDVSPEKYPEDGKRIKVDGS